MTKEKIETYPEAARVIHLWLGEFCDEERPYPDMIAEAARRAAKEIDRLRSGKQNRPEILDITKLLKVAPKIFRQCLFRERK